MMYASCPDFCDDVGRGHLTSELEKEDMCPVTGQDSAACEGEIDLGEITFLQAGRGGRIPRAESWRQCSSRYKDRAPEE